MFLEIVFYFIFMSIFQSGMFCGYPAVTVCISGVVGTLICLLLLAEFVLYACARA